MTTDSGDPSSIVRHTLRQAGPDAALIIDFDETLWLRNSTEEYLRSLRPRFLAYLILVALDVLRPWRLIGGRGKEHAYRDWLRVLVCTVLLPWSLYVWRRQAPRLGWEWRNQALLSALEEAGAAPFRVATLGVDVIVEPLLRHVAPHAELFAAGSLWSGHRIRLLGKEAWITQRYGPDIVPQAVVITDSEADAELLASCRHPILVRWPDSEYRPAFEDAYVPFLYTQRGKRPGENYMLYGVVLEDIVLLCLAFAWIMTSPLLGVLGLVFLHLSFWTIYEIGYVENDTRAVAHEAKPKIWEGSAEQARRVRPALAWVAAMVFAVPGAYLLAAFNPASIRFADMTGDTALLTVMILAFWGVYLAITRIAYWVYNRSEVGTRGVFYVVLQLLRTIGYGALLSINAVGAVILLSLVLARWVKYLVYRDVGRKMPEDQRFLALLFFVVLSCGAIAAGPEEFLGFQAATAFVWLAAYCRRRLLAFMRQVRLVRADAPPSGTSSAMGTGRS